MSLRTLPEIRAESRLAAAEFDIRPEAAERWRPEVRAAQEGEASISIYDTIGATWDGSGVTANRISAALRSIGQRDVVVNINSPGGDFFEGVAIYNMLRQHAAKVTVRVMSLAASAASVIAMAGDEILMGEGSFLMIHNAWAVAVGNRHDLTEAAAWLEPFDVAMADLYAARSGQDLKKVAKMLDDETWLGTSAAIEAGFADGRLDRSQVSEDAQASGQRRALAVVESALAKIGQARSTRRDTLQSLFSGMPCAGGESAKPCAGDDIAALLQTTLTTLRG